MQYVLISNRPPHRSLGGDLDILSASQYPHALTQPYEEMEQSPRKRKATLSSHRDGSLSLAKTRSESTPSSANEAEQAQPQKKTKSTKRPSNEDEQTETRKQRGRPRLNTQDETAADRRRTQIRLAQRAYRHHKETTISTLKAKITDLQSTIEQMNKTFLTLHDNMVDAGILTSHYSLGRQLQAATEEFMQVAKMALPESDEENIAKITRGEPKRSSPASVNHESNRRGSANG
ncbi:uncharacterized protein Z518_04811 [Rhinocladiella mackenziei CBS 650.93]|uniref:BZIP domain-containing protein n=1 Tax=Rhinocladiella mackenziei CBS 650.93 TaxID=1442369 RepID=A0A0D2JCJ2_9EURO|nr:uncharacterized protein Z518_04811 [Rhinocladiella mackenziei CBS 650.93]KIX06835.1 hypothetical protein Z518_04811 [Rhinocladiella mackenziei CBS 650.93]